MEQIQSDVTITQTEYDQAPFLSFVQEHRNISDWQKLALTATSCTSIPVWNCTLVAGVDVVHDEFKHRISRQGYFEL